MPITIVRLGSPRLKNEGLRIGTVRRPPRGVPRSDFASRNFYDVWLPTLAPSEALVKHALAARSDREWQRIVGRYRTEMKASEPSRLLDLLAALSQHTRFSVGCYCADAERCHRSVLEALLRERGASVSRAPIEPRREAGAAPRRRPARSRRPAS